MPPPKETRRTRTHRGYKIVVLLLGDDWNGIIYGRDSNIVASDIEGISAQEVMVRAMRLVDERVG